MTTSAHRLPRAGVALAHKPAGATSFSLVQAFSAELARDWPGTRIPVCHGGALDPFATGLLPLLFGPATKLFELLHALPKTYVAEVAWGVETDNGDPTGKELARGDASALSPALLDCALAKLAGWTEQVPPNTSNKRVEGERAWQKAHRGEEFSLPPSRVYLHAARWLAHDLPRSSRLELTCRGGFYVRALARDLGRALGCRAHLAALDRVAIGPWKVASERVVVTGPAVLPWARSRALTDEELGKLRRGESLEPGKLDGPEWLPPAGFPDLDAPIRGVHQGHLAALLTLNPEGRLVGPLLGRGL